MSTLALLIFVVMALFTAWFIPWYIHAILKPLFDTCRVLPRARHLSVSSCL